MGTISSKALREALTRAKSIGLVEERFQIGDCDIVLRNLRPDEYEAVLNELRELENLEYLNAFQKAHIARSIVELNGCDLRDTQYVEDEQPDPKNQGSMRKVKLELHAFLRKNVLDSWSKEAIFVAYRKFGDVVSAAEKQAKDKVTFTTAEEAPADKLRRLLGEIRELEDEIPPALVETTLAEFGYNHKLSVTLDRRDAPEGAPPEGAPPQGTQSQSMPSEAAVQPNQGYDLARMMRERVPMNQTAAATAPVPQPVEHPQAVYHAPPPAPPTPPQYAQPQPVPVPLPAPVVYTPQPVQQVTPVYPIASPNMPPGVPVHVMPGQVMPGTPVPPPPTGYGPVPQTGRGAVYAAMEMGVDPSLTAALLEGSTQAARPAPAEVPVISGSGAERVNVDEVRKIIDQPPKVGMNPYYRPPTRLP
jgi:hypothetical protein